MTATSSDAPLVARLLGGEAAAFAEIVLQHRGTVYGYLRARLAQPSDAEDLTQEAFLRFYLARARFDSSQMLRPWLLGIARNLLREHVRAVRKRKEVVWTELCLELEGSFSDASGDEAAERLSVCLDSLGPSARDAIELKYRSDWRLSRIAERLRRSEGAVKLLLFRARQALRHCLERRPAPPLPAE